jgi:hypothetical protein
LEAKPGVAAANALGQRYCLHALLGTLSLSDVAVDVVIDVGAGARRHGSLSSLGYFEARLGVFGNGTRVEPRHFDPDALSLLFDEDLGHATQTSRTKRVDDEIARSEFAPLGRIAAGTDAQLKLLLFARHTMLFDPGRR